MVNISQMPADLGLAGWTLSGEGKAISKQFRFAGFADAMAFMLRISYVAEAMDHHPEWSNVYNRVDVRLTTHDSGGLTQKDIDLAFAMEKAAR
jgi:4a-hydroxytetrahydrobiopterin dehydratase